MLRYSVRKQLSNRCFSLKQASKVVKKYTHTINLPQTQFPRRLDATARSEVEVKLLKGPFACAYADQEHLKREPAFVLHDGPPYANGDLHMGHAVNKIIKDITLRYNVAKGNKVNYVPGWDCHGMPIELKATQLIEDCADNEKAVSIRQKSCKFAYEAVEKQKSDFQRWGILADWEHNNAYLTLKPEFTQNQLELFYDLYTKGLVYRGLKPVYWSPSSRTALAEAELEYDENFQSPSVYVRLEIQKLPAGIKLSEREKAYIVIWTTTPWSLASNQAICYNSSLPYVLVRFSDDTSPNNHGAVYVVAESFVNILQDICESSVEILQKVSPDDLSLCTYKHPLPSYVTVPLPLLHSDHVRDEKGTGLVHLAPAHGPDDFLVGLKNNMQIVSLINEAGKYNSDAPDFLQGVAALEEGGKLILQYIADNVLHASTVKHAYPIDWRTKKPVLIRASEQWFFNTECLKDRAAEEIKKINLYPKADAENNRRALTSQVTSRPYWCISRQRSWGVPIPVLYDKSDGKVVTSRKIISHLSAILKKEGNFDFWWTRPLAEIVPHDILQELGYTAENLVKGSDIFDIWFDSGSSWLTVLQGEKVADLYSEGYDQFSGWFQSSLLTSLAMRNSAPYRALFVHGFVVDEKKGKMSKSLGNVVVPKDLISQYGVDALRLWVAAHGTQHTSIPVSANIVLQSAASLTKIRSTLHYMNGYIGKHADPVHIDLMRTCFLNKYLLHVLVKLDNELTRYYRNYEYSKVIMSLLHFVANEFSAQYVHLIKDRLYCGSDSDFKDVRYTLRQCYQVFCKHLWPVTPFLVEESWLYYDESPGFHRHIVSVSEAWFQPEIESIFDTALNYKRILNQNSGKANTWTLSAHIVCKSVEDLHKLQRLQGVVNEFVSDSDLCEILQVGSVLLSSEVSPEKSKVKLQPLERDLCPRCRRYTLQSEAEVCDRCTSILETK